MIKIGKELDKMLDHNFDEEDLELVSKKLKEEQKDEEFIYAFIFEMSEIFLHPEEDYRL